jgi:putative acetyltransferase
MIFFREEDGRDFPAVRAVHLRAFGSGEEADLVDRLRAFGRSRISLVAEHEGLLAGHVMFSPVRIAARGTREGLGLAPLAVLPGLQRLGIGSRLVERGIAECRHGGCPYVVVLGAPAYYRRFGFRPARELGLRSEFGHDEAFQVLEIAPGALPPEGGLVAYGPEFDRWKPSGPG